MKADSARRISRCPSSILITIVLQNNSIYFIATLFIIFTHKLVEIEPIELGLRINTTG